MNQRGLVMVTAFGVMVMLTVLGASFLLRGLHENRISDRSHAQHRSLFVAEASLDAAINQLRAGNVDDVPTTAMSGGSYWAQITDPGEDPTLGSFNYRIVGHGLYGSEQRDVEAMMHLVPESVFQFALFGSQSLSVSGNATTDSYNSLNGLYDPATAGNNGDIGTNATTAGGVTLSGTYFIDGQIVVGPNVGNPESVVTGYNPAFVTGNPDVVSQSTALQVPPATTPSGLSCDTDLTVSGSQTITLPLLSGGYCSGSVCCVKDLTVSGGGTLDTTGAVTIYVTGQLSAGGNTTIGSTITPGNLIMLLTSTQTGSLGSISGTTVFSGGLYAPSGGVNISGSAQLYGSVVANSVTVSGQAQVHYDEAMTAVGPAGSYDVQVLQWRDL